MRDHHKEYDTVDIAHWEVDREFRDFFHVTKTEAGINLNDMWEKDKPETEEEITEHYKHIANPARMVGSRHKRYAAIREILPILTAHNHLGNRVLDFACGTGEFGIMMATLGFQVDFVDVEGSETLKFLKHRLRRRYLKGNILGHKDPLGKYDIVFYINSLEHMIKPEETILKIADSLESNGIMILEWSTSEVGNDLMTKKYFRENVEPIINDKFTLHKDGRNTVWIKK